MTGIDCVARAIDESETEYMLASIARALHHWCRLENSLTDFLSRCMDARDPGAAGAVWDNIVLFKQKLKVTSAMFELCVEEEGARQVWHQLSARVYESYSVQLELAEYRRQLALGNSQPQIRLSAYASSGDDSVSPTPRDERKLPARTPRYTVSEIEHAAREICELADCITWFSDWVVEYKQIPTSYATPPPRLIHQILSRA